MNQLRTHIRAAHALTWNLANLRLVSYKNTRAFYGSAYSGSQSHCLKRQLHSSVVHFHRTSNESAIRLVLVESNGSPGLEVEITNISESETD